MCYTVKCSYLNMKGPISRYEMLVISNSPNNNLGGTVQLC